MDVGKNEVIEVNSVLKVDVDTWIDRTCCTRPKTLLFTHTDIRL